MKRKYVLIIILVLLICPAVLAYRYALSGTPINRYDLERDTLSTATDEDMYINIESNLNNVVYLNISGINQENLTMKVRSGRHWVITGEYI